MALHPAPGAPAEAACAPTERGAAAGGIVFLGDRCEAPPRPWAPRARPAAAADTPSRPDQRAAEHDQHGELFRRLCEARGLDATVYRTAAVRRRERACAHAVGAAGAALAPEQVERGLSAVLIGVTSFFRDEAAFAALAAALDAGPSMRRAGLRVLSVGCSDGCELYSVGMLLGERGRLDHATLLGIDCRAGAIARAIAARYAEPAVRAVDERRRARWLERDGDAWRVRSELADRATWLVADAFAVRGTEADLVLCRNLAIYLEPGAADRLWQRLAGSLRPGGLLLAGKAERPPAAVGLERIGPCLFRKGHA